MRTGRSGGFACTALGAALALALASAALGGAVPASPTPPTPDAARATVQPIGAHRAGLIAVLPGSPVDPGSAASPPGVEAAFADPELAAALSTSSEGLYEETLPDGGVGVRLQGRFRSVLFATVGPDGTVQRAHRQLSPTEWTLDPNRGPNSCRPFPGAAGEVTRATQ